MKVENETVKTINEVTIDLSYLEEVCGGDQDFIKSIIDTYVTDVPTVIEHLVCSCAKSDWYEVGQAAHQLKPSLQFVGLHNALIRAKTIEQSCKQNIDLSLVPELVNLVVLDVQASFSQFKLHFSL